jgi:hypothetical protein
MIDFPDRHPPTTTDRALCVAERPRRQDGHGIALSSAMLEPNYFKKGPTTNLVVQF